jgi:hypothetical protein
MSKVQPIMLTIAVRRRPPLRLVASPGRLKRCLAHSSAVMPHLASDRVFRVRGIGTAASARAPASPMPVLSFV